MAQQTIQDLIDALNKVSAESDLYIKRQRCKEAFVIAVNVAITLFTPWNEHETTDGEWDAWDGSQCDTWAGYNVGLIG